MSNQKKNIVGYDVRVSFQKCQENWDEKRRKEYLYKEDALVPLSTDSITWVQSFEPNPEDLSFTGHQMLWTSLDALKSRLSQRVDLSSGDYLIIAIEVVLDKGENDEILTWQKLSKSVTPNTPNTQWNFLGYDISDRWLLSGLSNCGFLPEYENVNLLKEKWKKHLNQYHLFVNVVEAVKFKKFADMRVSEHAPFFVFKLWLVP